MMRLVSILLFCVVFVCAPKAWAECAPSDRPVVVLVTRVKPPDQLIADQLQRHLKASLNDRGIDLCMDSSEPRDAIGRILLEVKREGTAPVSALIRIGDRITNKRVERTMELDAIPIDARPLAVSAAADELLRASWAELLLTDAPAPLMEPPEAVVSSVSESLAPRRFQLGLEAAGTWFAGLGTLGPILHVGYAFSERWSLAVRGHFAASLAQESPNGAVSLTRQGAQLVGSYTFYRGSQHLSVDWQLGAELARFEILATPDQPDASVTRTLDWTVEAQTGPRAFWSLGERALLTLGAVALYSLRPVAATDDGNEVLSNSGPGVQVTLGAHALF